jgi:hypothetical protein
MYPKKPRSGSTDSNVVDTWTSKQNTAHVPELRTENPTAPFAENHRTEKCGTFSR